MCQLRAGTALPAMKRVIIRFRERQLEALAREQATTGPSQAALVRRAVDSYLAGLLRLGAAGVRMAAGSVEDGGEGRAGYVRTG